MSAMHIGNGGCHIITPRNIIVAHVLVEMIGVLVHVGKCREWCRPLTSLHTHFVSLQQLAQKLGWQPVDTLTRLPGFTDPWEFAVCQGRSVNLGATLTANGIMTDAAITIVRRVLVPEAWKVCLSST